MSTTSTASGIINHHRLIRKRLESHPLYNHHQDLKTQSCSNQRHGLGSQAAATTSSSFTNAFNIPDKVTSLSNKALSTDYALRHRYCRCIGIKGSTPIAFSLGKYTWEVVDCIFLTSKMHWGPDICLEISKQAKSTEIMMKLTWGTKAIRRQEKASKMLDWPLCLTDKETRHVSVFLLCNYCQQNHWFGHRF